MTPAVAPIFTGDRQIDGFARQASAAITYLLANGITVASSTTVTAQTTTSASYADLATVGPSVTVETGPNVLLAFGAMTLNTANQQNSIAVAVSGATTIAAADYAAGAWCSTVNQYVVLFRMMAVTGLSPGRNTFTLRYATSGGTATFVNRDLTVWVLP